MKRRSNDREPRPPQSSRQWPKRAARIIGFQIGSRWRLDGAVVTVLAVLSEVPLLLSDASDSTTEILSASEFVPIEGTEGAVQIHRPVAQGMGHRPMAIRRACPLQRRSRI